MLVAHAMGMGSCIIGSATAALNAPFAKNLMQIPDHYEAVVPIVID